MQCSKTRSGLIWLMLIVPVRISQSAILMYKWQERYEAGCCNSSILCDLRSRKVFIYSHHHMHICVFICSITCLHILVETVPSMSADSFFEIAKALHSASIQAAALLWSPTRGFYLVILLFHCIPLRNAMQHPEGCNKYPGPSLSSITHSRQWRRERKEEEEKGRFLFELERGGIYSWPYTIMTSLINQIHNSWGGKVCCERGGVGEGGDKTAPSAFSWRGEDRGEHWSVYLCLTNMLCMCLTNTPAKMPLWAKH